MQEGLASRINKENHIIKFKKPLPPTLLGDKGRCQCGQRGQANFLNGPGGRGGVRLDTIRATLSTSSIETSAASDGAQSVAGGPPLQADIGAILPRPGVLGGTAPAGDL